LDYLLHGTQLNEAIGAEKRGDEVIFAYCNGVLSKCQVNITGNPLICKLCKITSKNTLNSLSRNIKIIPLNREYRKSKFDLEKEFPFQSVQELKQLEYQGVSIGYGVLSFFISCTRIHDPVIDKKFKYFIYDILSMCLDMINQCNDIISLFGPDKIQLFNGRQFQTRPLMDLAIKNNLKFVCNEVKFDFVHNSGWKILNFENTLPHDTTNAYTRSVLTWNSSCLSFDEKVKLGKMFFEKKRKGIPAGDKSFTANHIEKSLPVGFDKSKRNIAIFNNSEDEFAALGAEFESKRMFDSQLDGIRFILDKFKNNSDVVFYLRIHPNLKGVQYSYHTDLYKLSSEFLNVRVISAESSVSTYSLIDNSEKIIVFGSTTGVEASYWGKAVILLGPSFYMHHDVCYIARDKTEIEDLVLSYLKPKSTMGAIIYGHYILDCSVLAREPEYKDINPPLVKCFGTNYVLNKFVWVCDVSWINNILSIILNKGLLDKIYVLKKNRSN
jgi:hypothetical protein